MRPVHQMLLGLIFVMSLLGAGDVFGDMGGLMPAALLGLALYAVSLLLIRWLDPDKRARLDELFALALAVRWVMAAFNYLVIGATSPGLFAPDEVFYDMAGRYYSEYLAGRIPNPYPEGFPGGVIWLSGICYNVFGFTPLVPRFINGIVGAWTAVLTGLVALRLLNADVARRAALITALTPSLIVWSAVNTKDTMAMLGAQLSLYAFLLLRERLSPSHVVVFAAGLLLIAGNRSYEVLFIGVAVVAGVAFARRKRVLRNAVISVALLAVLALISQRSGAANMAGGDDTTLATIGAIREGFAAGAGSAVNLNLVDTSTATGLALWAPLGVFYFYFAPIPFTGTSSISIATSPEMLAWYFLLPAAWRGGVLTVKHRFRDTMPLLAYVLASSIGWSIIVTNVGTLYRYRAQVLFIPIIFIAADMLRKQYARAQRAANRVLEPPSVRGQTNQPVVQPIPAIARASR